MSTFLISVLSGLIATALFETIRSPQLRRRITSILTFRPVADHGGQAISITWLTVRITVTIFGAFIGSGFLAAILERLGHPIINLTDIPGVLLAAIAGLGAWTATRTARRAIRAFLSTFLSIALMLAAVLPAFRSTGVFEASATVIAAMFLLFLAIWEVLGLIPALRPAERS